jgi:translation initiation factor 4E
VSCLASTLTMTTNSSIKKSARPPSLNQLAARLNSNATVVNSSNAPSVSAPRPRLAAFALRTGSNTSNDSLAVNAPSTRAASPSNASNTSTTSLLSAKSSTPVNENGGEPLTTEKLEELNQENAASAASDPVKIPDALPVIPEVPRRKVGYKNIPSLDAITARLAKARSLSVDGSAMPPEPQMIEDPKTPGLVMKAPEHPLQFPWCVDICHLKCMLML